MNDVIGSHVSFTKDKQLLGSVLESLSYKANTFMFYTGAPQNTKRTVIDEELTSLAHKLMDKENININNVVVHAPYIINLANINNYDFNIRFLKEEISRVESLGITKLVLHPGSHVGQGTDIGIENIIKSLNEVITENQDIIICLETMAGKGTEIGSTFEELKKIIDGIKYQSKIAVCFDTCHTHDAGYDLSGFDKILDQFNQIIGLDKLLVMHINDSKNEMSASKDRHENIGLGKIGYEIILNIINNVKIKNVPKILETPYIDNKYPPYKFEIEMLRNKEFNEKLIEEIVYHYKDCKNG
jgi:apurinic endonuclease (APN1)